MSKRTSDAASLFEGQGNEQPRPIKRPARPRAPPKLAPPLYKASVQDLADSATIRVSSSTADLDNATILRIKKCLDRANHPNTPQPEAKAAFYLASRLMKQYNVSQAEVLCHESPSIQRQYAGESIVSIQRVDGNKDKSVRMQTYADDLCTAMAIFFDCETFSTSNFESLDLTFYGIAENTVAAAMSFEMAYNLINEWARPHKGAGSKNSYCLGVAVELLDLAIETKEDEEYQARKVESDNIVAKVMQEKAERQAQLDRLAPLPENSSQASTPEPSTNDDVDRNINGDHALYDNDSSDTVQLDLEKLENESEENFIEPDFRAEEGLSDINSFRDVDEEISRLVKLEPQSPKPSLGLYSHPMAPLSRSRDPCPLPQQETTLSHPALTEPNSVKLEPELESKWASHNQLVTFRETATKIANEYLKEKGIAICKRKANKYVIRDQKAFDQGVKDSKKIDVHRKTIKE